ncbi:MAG: MBL fold metallo-hydrolase [Clostridia bacterium]|nr:MBL fold metallo-hydrolase [Clostridia bacterium]
MKLTYLGTAAAEGFPALFCNCAYCQDARRLGGKNIRTRSQVLINDDLLLDLPADTYHHFLQNNIEGDKIRYLLISHSHSDHCYPNDLMLRGHAFAHDMRADTLEVYGSQGAFDRIRVRADEMPNVNSHCIHPFETVTLGQYTVTAFPARHMPGDGACFFLIRGDKTVLYAHDTGYFYEEVFAYLQAHAIVLDMISLDCTNVDIPIDDEGTHMGFANIERVLKRLTAIGTVNGSTVKIVNHFSHNGNPLHNLLTARAAQIGCDVSYDGMTVNL